MKTLKKMFSALLALALVLTLVPAMGAKAAPESSSLTIAGLEDGCIVGKARVFTVTTNVSEADSGKQVRAYFTFDADAKVEYLESQNDEWYVFPGKEFGPADGFPFTDGFTSTFRVTFNEAGSFDLGIRIETVGEGSELLAQAETTVTSKATSGEVNGWKFAPGYGSAEDLEGNTLLKGESKEDAHGPYAKPEWTDKGVYGFGMGTTVDLSNVKPGETPAFSFSVNGTDDYLTEATMRFCGEADGSVTLIAVSPKVGTSVELETPVTSADNTFAVMVAFTENKENGLLHVRFFVNGTMIYEEDSDVEYADVAATRSIWAFDANVEDGIVAGKPYARLLSHTEAHDVEAREGKAPTCTEDGQKAYWYCTECEKMFSDAECTKEVTEEELVLKATGHKAEKAQDEKAPTCTEDGQKAYWHCTECGKMFSDAECTKEVTKEDLILKATGHKDVKAYAEKAPTCTEDGQKAYWYCTECGKMFSDAECTKEVAEKELTLKATGHKDVKAYAAKAPTCTEDGWKAYWKCEDCGKLFDSEECVTPVKAEDLMLKKLGHDVEKVEAKDPTEKAEGNITYWYCKTCNKYFSDEALTKEIDKKDTVRAKIKNEGKASTTPKTGDDSNVSVWGLLAVAALLAGGATVYSRKKKFF